MTLPEILARHTHTASQANVTMTVPVADMRRILPLATLGHAYLAAAEAWTALGSTDNQPDAPQRLTPKREAVLAAVQSDAMRDYTTKNLALADTLRAYRQEHT